MEGSCLLVAGAGRVTAGSLDEADASGETASGMIERAVELAELQNAVATMATTVERRRHELGEADAGLARLSEERAGLATTKAESERAHALATAKIERDTTEAGRAETELGAAG